MRRLSQFLLIAVFTFLLPGSLHANVNGTPLKHYPKHSLLYENLNVEHLDLLGEIILLPEESFDYIEVAKIISRIDALPEKMLRRITEERIYLALFNGKLTDNPSARDLRGVIPRGYKTDKTWDEVPGVGGSKLVLAKIGSSEQGAGHSSVNLELHELAHSIDRHVYKLIREDPKFLEIWKKETKYLFPGRDYFLNYPEEYFAETFAMYYLGGEHKELLRKVAPETYWFIDSLE
ncbi:toxin [Mesobacillus maritimus]|uniref:anthrax toxin lethal factor-related metalloendopeptidase n=1 Tax=Mesobacillus maritimus TaxID=1643336 RepID=UPI00384A7500